MTRLLLLIFRVALSRWALGSPDHGGTILLMGVAILFTVAGSIQVGVLNAHHRVAALAKFGVVNTLAGAVIMIGSVIVWRLNGVVFGVIAAGVVNWAASWYFLRREVERVRARPSREDTRKAVVSLLRFGIPFTASQFVGTGVQLALPFVVLHLLSTDSVGYYRAAVGISVGYLGFLITAMGQDYYPRLSAVSDQPNALVKLINEQHRLVMILAVPVILGTLALVPFLVPLVYSLKFGPTVDILEWQMIGDIFKFSSWTMSFAILARCGSSTYFLSEFLGGAANIGATWLCVRLFGLQGLGIGFLVAYIIYYFVAWVIVRREIPLVWTASNKKMMLGAVAAALFVRLLPATRFASFRTPVGLALAFLIGIPSLMIIWREFMVSGDSDGPGAGKPGGQAAVPTGVHSSSN
jgi:antigen flippase